MQLLLNYLESIYPLGEALRERLETLIKSKKLERKEYLLRAGQVNREIYFIKEGLLWCYRVRKEHEVVSWFMKEGDTIVSVLSFYDQVKSRENIQALEDCDLYYIRYEELEELYHTFPWFNYIGRVLTIKYLKMFVLQAEGLRGLSAEERYRFVVETQPDIALRVPIKYMASHLGINEYTLSKIRGKK